MKKVLTLILVFFCTKAFSQRMIVMQDTTATASTNMGVWLFRLIDKKPYYSNGQRWILTSGSGGVGGGATGQDIHDSIAVFANTIVRTYNNRIGNAKGVDTIYFDATASTMFWRYNNTIFSRALNGTSGISKVDSIWRNPGIDSFYYAINSNIYAIKDSTLDISSLTLQTVTDNGNTTTNNIEAENIRANGGVISWQKTASDYLIETKTEGPSIGLFNRGQIKGDSISNDLLKWYLPDTSGVFITSINGYMPNKKGQIILPITGGTGSFDTTTIYNNIALKLNISDTAAMLADYVNNASNGLQKLSSKVIGMGGTLNQHTTIDGDGGLRRFIINNPQYFRVNTTAGGTFGITNSGVDITGAHLDIDTDSVTISNATTSTTTNNILGIQANGKVTRVNLGSGLGIISGVLTNTAPIGTDSSVIAGFGLTKNIASNVINLKVDTTVIATPYDLTVIDSKISNRILGTITSDAEDNKPSADLIQKSTNSYTRGWIDGQFLWTVNDTLFSYGGWFTGNFIYDTIYRSTNDGATWTAENFYLPYPGHTVSNCEGTDGYNYMIGGDAFTTLTQRKTVSRTNNGGRTWETMTTAAPFQNILGSSWMDEKGNLYHGGGQNDFAGDLCDTLWKSTDGGANWTIYATGMTILAGNTSNLVKYVNGRCILASGGVYNPPSSTFTKKTYSFPIDNPKAWVEHSDVPSPTGLQYANAVVYDGKYWLIQGNDGSVNKNGVYYLDKNYNWNTYINYTDNVKANVLPISHANGITVHRNKIIIGVGNDFNNTYILEPSKYQTFTHFRDSIKLGTYSSISEVENSLSTLIGNNVKAGTTNNTIRRVSDPDEGNYYNQGLDGKWWGKLTLGVTANTDVADNTGIQMKLNNSNELIISTNAAYDAGNFRLQVDGDAHFSNLIRQPALAGNNRVPYIDANGDMNSNGNLFYSGTNLLQVGAGSMVYPSTIGFSTFNSTPGVSNGFNATNTSATDHIQLMFGETTSNYGGFFKWNSGYAGNYTGTSLPFANSFQAQSGNANQQSFVVSAGALVHNVGVSGTNAAIRSDANGLRIGRNSNIHNANTVQLEVEGTILLNTGNQGAGKVLTSDASGNADWVTPTFLSSSNFVYNEEFTGSTSSTYTLANTPIAGKLVVFKNGVKLPNSEFSLSGAVVTLTSARLTTDIFSNDYIK